MKFHHENLRINRLSLPYAYYAITKCCINRIPFLIQDINNPGISTAQFEIIRTTIEWLNKEGHVSCHHYTMMPDHVHMIFQLLNAKTLDLVMQSFSSFTSKEINKVWNRTGAIWQPTYYDHLIRSQNDYDNQIEYLRQNPVKAGFVSSPDLWPFTVGAVSGRE